MDSLLSVLIKLQLYVCQICLHKTESYEYIQVNPPHKLPWLDEAEVAVHIETDRPRGSGAQRDAVEGAEVAKSWQENAIKWHNTLANTHSYTPK